MQKTAQKYFVHAFELIEKGKLPQAIKEIGKGLRFAPNNYGAIVNRCTCYSLLEQFPEVFKDDDRFVGLYSNNHVGYLLAGKTLS